LSDQSGTLADDPFSARHPTSHERLTGLTWDASYHVGPAPWDIGQPQPTTVRLASEGGFAGAVLDAGGMSSPAADAFQLERLGRRFETVLDRGLFHTFDGDERPHYVASLAFNPGTGWNVAAIEPDRVQTTYHDDGAPAWFASIERI
jgi:hypothetical protein